MRNRLFAALFLGAMTLGMGLPGAASAQASGRTASNAVVVENIVVHGASLEGNLEGDSADRSVTVFLPPSYARERSRRYPVIYGLHGYTINNEIWAGEINAAHGLEAAYGAGAREMIVVLPSTQTLHNGSMYSSSVTIGDWEGFITHDLVGYIDAHYRTIPNRASRGLFGHSMGGYGASRLGMKYPGIFAALYIMSPCCMSARGAPPGEVLTRLEGLHTREETTSLGFLDRATLAVGAAWSPNPNRPPLFMDLPSGDGAAQSAVLARWAANAPLAMVEQNVFNLRRYAAIAIDVGDQDGLRVDAAEFHRILNDSNVENTFEIYPGDHVSGVANRFEHHVLPLFSETLEFGR
jgi:S-formylglutathione hydrolase FrmB